MAKQLEERLLEVVYNALNTSYIPSQFALEFLAFIKLVNGAGGEENSSPTIHMDMLDQIVSGHRDNLFVAARGTAKTTVLCEYMYLYIAVYGKLPEFGNINVAIYVSDTMDNGVKSMRQQLEFRYNKSVFMKQFVPEAKFTDVRWEFTNISGKKFCVRGFGASTGVRGFKEYGQRPTVVMMDDLLSDKNAESPTIVKDITAVVYKAVRNAMHPSKRMVIWSGTPFNKKDPLYSAAGSDGWNTRVYPICEKYPCTPEEFVGAWEDRFPYEFVKSEYDKLFADGQISAFNQELMLKIVSEEDRLIQDSDLMWYQRSAVMQNRSNFNFYITTDFATSSAQSADYSTLFVWAYNANGDWFLVEAVVKRQLMDANVNDLFRLAQLYKPQGVGVEVTGQQGGFIPWIKNEMMSRNIWFNLASENNNNKEGIRPVTNKLQRFNVIVPWFKAKSMYFPEDLKDTFEIQEVIEELTLVTSAGIKSKHDDCIDGVSQLGSLKPWKPSAAAAMKLNPDTDVWEDEVDHSQKFQRDSYIV